MNKNELKIYFITLLILVIISSLLYYLTINSDVNTFSILILALFYMPTPLIALLISSKISNQNVNLLQYGNILKLSFHNIKFTLQIISTWIILLFFFSFIASYINPTLFGKLIISVNDFNTNLVNITSNTVIDSQSGLSPDVEILIHPAILFILFIVSALISGATINLLFALGEEYGWRGYLSKRINGSFWKKYLIISIIWGFWHAPIIFLGYNYGIAYSPVPVLVFIAFCISMGYALGLVKEYTNNIVYPAFIHGFFNAFAGITLLFVTKYNPYFGGTIGLLSILAWFITTLIWYHKLASTNEKY